MSKTPSSQLKSLNYNPDSLIKKVAENVATLKNRYGKSVLVVETGYYNDRALEANQWLCNFLQLLMEAGASGLYYWEPELADDYDMGAWNPITRKPSIALDAFLGLQHFEGVPDAVQSVPTDSRDNSTEYYTLDGVRIEQPKHGLNIVKQQGNNAVRSYKVLIK